MSETSAGKPQPEAFPLNIEVRHKFSPFSCPIFLGHPKARGLCSQGERVLYGRDLCRSGGTGKAEAAKLLGAGIDSKGQSTYGLPQLYAISRALTHLKIIPRPLPRGAAKTPWIERLDTDGIAAEWVDWCFAWYRQSRATPRTRKHGLFKLLQIGRWLAHAHPAVTNPEHWDYSVAADFG
jgi:hypothetical protein